MSSNAEQDGPLLTGGTILKDRWEILRKIGRGGFGEIYKAKDHDGGERCAVKVESAVSSKQVLKMEVVVLKKLQSCSPHICTLLGCGRTEKINYIVMTLLGPNISELRKQQPNQRFSLSTTLRVAVQVIAAVRAIHNCGFLHRDIKPSNFAIGAALVTKQTCYMLDFGLARQYVTSTGELRPPRPVAGFRGTVRYASVNAHQSKDLGRHDDLWSVFYLIVELANGELPWKKIRDKDKAGKFKLGYDHKKLLKHLPAEFYDFLDHLKSLDYFQEPDYVMLSTLVQNAIRYLGIKRSDLFDWEQDLSIQSLTTISAGSAPALQTNNRTGGGGKEKDEEEKGDDSRTNVSTEECLGLNPAAKKDSDNIIEREILRSGEEKGGSRDGNGGQIVRSKRHKHLDLIQQRRSMPPSPLLQATHLVDRNDSGLHHTSSLDRFFDMRPGEGGGASGGGDSPPNSCHSSPRIRDQRRVNPERGTKDNNTMASSPDEKPCSKNLAHRKREEEDGSKEQERKTNSIAILPNGVSVDEEAPGEISDNEKRDDLIRVNPEQYEEKEQALKEIDAIMRETAKLKVDSVQKNATSKSHHQRLIEVDHEPISQPIVGYSSEVVDREDKDGGRQTREGGGGGGGESREKRERSVPSDSSGHLVRHRLFAASVQNSGEGDKIECVSLEMIPRTTARKDAHSPGPPPLEFHKPQKMWGEDALKPMSLSQCHIHQSSSETKRRSSERLVFHPRPPDHPPPKHYTLLAARQRRFRKPTKS